MLLGFPHAVCVAPIVARPRACARGGVYVGSQAYAYAITIFLVRFLAPLRQYAYPRRGPRLLSVTVPRAVAQAPMPCLWPRSCLWRC